MASPWYKRWWGILIIIVLGLFSSAVLLFIFLVVKALFDIGRGAPLADLNSPAVNKTLNAPRQIFQLATNDAPSFGPKNAAVTIVEFGDFECPYCGQDFPVVRELQALYPKDLRFIFRDFPLTQVHPHAMGAALAADCAHEQGKFWAYHDKLFSNQGHLEIADLKEYAKEVGTDEAKFNACLDSGKYQAKVDADFQDGLAAGVAGTPTFFIDGRRVAGALSLDTFKRAVDSELARLK